MIRSIVALMCALVVVCGSETALAETKNYNEMTLHEQLRHTAINMPGPWTHPKVNPADETPEERKERVTTIVDAIMLELPHAEGLRGERWFWGDKELAWATYTKLWWESGRFSLKVHDGRKRGDRRKSVCLGQIMKGEESLVGTSLENTRNCVRRVMSFLVMHQVGCLGPTAKPSIYSLARIYAGYGTGRTCDANHWMKVHDGKGGYVKNSDGTYKRNYWALTRGRTFWKLYNGKHEVQKQ